MRRKNILSMALRGLILVILFAVVRQGVASSPPATLRAISASAPGSASGLQLRVDGLYSFNAVQASPDTLFIDLTPATAGKVAPKGEWSGGLLTGYSLLQFVDSNHQPVVRIQVEMKHHQAFQVQRTNDALLVVFGDNSVAPTAAGLAPTVSSAAPMETSKPVEPKIQAVKSSGGLAEVSGVSINSRPDGEVFVDVTTTQPTSYHVSQLNNPRRLVVDLDHARQSLHRKTYEAQSSLLSDVRIGQFHEKNPSIVRVVADLSGNPIFDVHAHAGGIRIELKSHASASNAAAPAVTASNAPTAKVVEVKSSQNTPENLTAKSSSEASGQQTAMVKAEPVIHSVSTVQAAPLTPNHSEYQNVLPGASGSKEISAAPRPDTSDQSPEALQAARAAKIIAGSAGTDTEAAQEQPAGVSVLNSDQVRYTGEPISLNLKDVDLKDFFRLIHEISGLNILVDPNVTGTLTLVLDNVPWDQALDIVLKDYQLGKTLDGNVLRISKLETLTAQQEAASKLVAAREDAQPLVTRFVPVNYAKAQTIQTLLKTWVGGGALTKRGNILVDDRTNTLIVSDIASQIPVILQIISKLDTKTKQISIEARIVRTTNDFSRILQSALSAAWLNQTTAMAGGSGAGSTANGAGKLPLVTTAPLTGFGVYAITNAGAHYIINAAIAAEESKAELKTISKPFIVTQNNVPGTITQGVQIPIQTSINNTVTITYAQAALTLTVTPQVTADGNIFLIIKVDNSSVGAVLTAAGPSINTQSATTQVLVPDGGTVIFGGVTLSSHSHSDDYVPILGQIPVIGHLFKNTNTTTNDQELVFFVTPKVLPG